MKRNTKQKDIIWSVIKDDKTHPTINEIVVKVKNIDKSIGIATIYRNINNLVLEGNLKKIELDNTHYDSDISNHNHFVCSNCHRIIDIYDDNYNLESLSNNYDFKIEKVNIIYEGLCKDCLNGKDL